ncbi:electron transport complex subunit RsxC [Enterococcus sp. BWR-S5]|uniref:electron transport complex subunit RsxC n=1 Tax=Enterococcus sp. BWR-S5 TaxID=2787714 RepID=UPI001920DF3F|nr:electron transport complex subunit RsxC [Enterococcus sp. BWR-S5]MBL1226166.1 electron transport complex subunit RsxC [Enterococcus sp. BWR-S5]
MRKSFNGGLNLHENDVLHLRGINNYKAIETIQPKRVYIPVQQHIGDASEVVVEIGATVTLGQTIATSGDGLGAHIHASVSGTIVAVKPIDQGQGDKSLCVVIENDFQETVCKEKPYSMDRFTQEMIVDRVEAAGVVGLGGATFPSHVKLSPRENIHTCIFNGAECEPLLMADAALMATQGEKLSKGCQLVLKAVAAKEGIIVIEDDKQEAISVMRKWCDCIPNLTVLEVPSIYPQGSTELLFKAVTGLEEPTGGSTRDLGYLVINVSTTAAIYDAVMEGTPLSHRICSVVGDVQNQKNVRFPMGTTVSDMIEFCGGFDGPPSKVIIGGFMMGRTIDTLDASLTKAANGLIIINETHDEDSTPSPCIDCARCVNVCPIGLLPHQLEKNYLKQNWKRMKKLYADRCINCGCCTYICPARRHLAKHIIAGQKIIEERQA